MLKLDLLRIITGLQLLQLTEILRQKLQILMVLHQHELQI